MPPSAALRLALYQPDIAQNTGTILRLGACLGLPVEVIEPCGFPFATGHGKRALGRAALDYLAHADIHRHADWEAFEAGRDPLSRLVLLSTAGDTPYTAARYRPGDVLLSGRESAGVPPGVHAAADIRVVIPMVKGLRCLNVALATAMVAGEALRQLRWSGQHER